MEKVRLNKTENITEEDISNINEKDREVLLGTLKAEKSDYWEKIIMAGEMALLGIDVLDNLSEEDKEKMRQELEGVRTRLKEAKDKSGYIDLARCVYRFQNIGLDYPELTDEEKGILEGLSRFFRQDQKWHGHLNYIPQIAQAVDKNIDEISSQDDYKLARKYLEEKLREGGEEELKNMIFSGLLVELNKKEAEKLLNGEYWNENRWTEVLKMIKEAKDNKYGYLLARYLPPLKKLIDFRERKI